MRYFSSDIARPNYVAAAEHCDSLGAALYKADSRVKQFLLYEIMNNSKYCFTVVLVNIYMNSRLAKPFYGNILSFY